MRSKLLILLVVNVITTGLVVWLLWWHFSCPNAEDVLTEFQIHRILNSAYVYYCDTGHWPNKETYISDLPFDPYAATNNAKRIRLEYDVSYGGGRSSAYTIIDRLRLKDVSDGYGRSFAYTTNATGFRAFSKGNDHEINTVDDVFGLCDINGNKGIHRPGKTMTTPHFKFDTSVQRWEPNDEDDGLFLHRSKTTYRPGELWFPKNHNTIFNY